MIFPHTRDSVGTLAPTYNTTRYTATLQGCITYCNAGHKAPRKFHCSSTLSGLNHMVLFQPAFT